MVEQAYCYYLRVAVNLSFNEQSFCVRMRLVKKRVEKTREETTQRATLFRRTTQRAKVSFRSIGRKEPLTYDWLHTSRKVLFADTSGSGYWSLCILCARCNRLLVLLLRNHSSRRRRRRWRSNRGDGFLPIICRAAICFLDSVGRRFGLVGDGEDVFVVVIVCWAPHMWLGLFSCCIRVDDSDEQFLFVVIVIKDRVIDPIVFVILKVGFVCSIMDQNGHIWGGQSMRLTLLLPHSTGASDWFVRWNTSVSLTTIRLIISTHSCSKLLPRNLFSKWKDAFGSGQWLHLWIAQLPTIVSIGKQILDKHWTKSWPNFSSKLTHRNQWIRLLNISQRRRRLLLCRSICRLRLRGPYQMSHSALTNKHRCDTWAMSALFDMRHKQQVYDDETTTAATQR